MNNAVEAPTYSNKSYFCYFFMSLLGIVTIYSALYLTIGISMLEHSTWDSYTLQSQAWLNGNVMLNHNYPHLELAIFNGNYYVSFPPLPSIPMALLIPFFGENTPNTLINTLYAIFSFSFIFYACKKATLTPWTSLLWALFYTLGCNLVSLSINGGVWFQAQALNFLLMSISVYFLIANSKYNLMLSLIFWALAIGCRPLQAIYFPVYLYLFILHINNFKSIKLMTIEAIKLALIPALIGISYATYNYIRFGNPIEFGHNYLPEFTRISTGQFSIEYIKNNYWNIFRSPFINGDLTNVQRYNGFAFYIANPIFIAFLTRFSMQIIGACRKTRKLDWLDLLVPACIIGHIIITLSHKTLGGWQFGLRYFIDIIPIIFLYILRKDATIYWYEYPLISFAISFNIWGAYMLFTAW